MDGIEEDLRAAGREARTLAELHAELARTELQRGALHLAVGIFLFGLGIAVGGLALAAASIALYLVLDRFLAAPLAGSLVALLLAALTLFAWWLAWRVLRGARSLSLPVTRQMLGELLRWRDGPTKS